MRIIKLAQLLQYKYKVAGDETASDRLELALRGKIFPIYDIIKKSTILRACAESGLKDVATPRQHMAKAGVSFLNSLVSYIDLLRSNYDKLSLGEIRYLVLKIAKLISDNKNPSFNGEISKIDFPHVSEAIYLVVPFSTKRDLEIRNQQPNIARTALKNIYSICKSALEIIAKLEIMVPEKFQKSDLEEYSEGVDLDEKMPARFKAQRGMMDQADKINFIRLYGADYGINNEDDWEIVFGNNPPLLEQITTSYNSLQRGNTPVDEDLKKEIRDILNAERAKYISNEDVFNRNDPSLNTHDLATQEHDRSVNPPIVPKPVEYLTPKEEERRDILLRLKIQDLIKKQKGTP